MDPETTTTRRQLTLPTTAGLLLVLLFALLPLAAGGDAAAITSEGLWASDALKWGLTLVLVLIVVAWEKRGARSIGLRRPRGREAVIGVLAAGGWLVLSGVLAGLVLEPAGWVPDTGTADALLALPAGQRLVVVGTAAVSEEVCFRGFLMERVEEATDRAWIAVLATVVLFVGGHALHFGPVTNGLQALLTLGLASLYLWRRDLTAPVVAHAAIDGWHLVVVPVLLA